MSSTYSRGDVNVNSSPLISAIIPANFGFATKFSTAFTAVDIGVRIIDEKRLLSARFVAMMLSASLRVREANRPMTEDARPLI